jgi:nitrate reductase gamma subunit
VNIFAFIIGVVLSYVVVPVFVTGMAYRFWVWFKTPQPAKMTLFPAGGSTFREVLAEALFFPSLFRGDRVLWFFSWLFHATLAIVLMGHLRLFTRAIDRVLAMVGMSPNGLDMMSSVGGGIGGIVLLATGGFLLWRRLAIPRVREITGVPDFFANLLVIAIIVTGDFIRFSEHFDLEHTRVWAVSLVSFSPVVPMNGLFLLHLALVQVLIMFIPFSKILHFGGIFFTHALIKRS